MKNVKKYTMDKLIAKFSRTHVGEAITNSTAWGQCSPGYKAKGGATANYGISTADELRGAKNVSPDGEFEHERYIGEQLSRD